MCFVWISEQTVIISLYNINWLVCITETQCVYCAVRTGSLCMLQFNVILYRINSGCYFVTTSKRATQQFAFLFNVYSAGQEFVHFYENRRFIAVHCGSCSDDDDGDDNNNNNNNNNNKFDVILTVHRR